MSLPIATYNLALNPFQPTPALEEDYPVTVRISLAALDPEATDDKEEPSTLRILKKLIDFDEDDDEDDDEDEDDDDEDEDELDEIKEKGNGKVKKADAEDDDDEEEEDDDDDEDELDEDIEEFVVCTLSPKHQYQQTLDLTILPDEEVYFVVTGSYPIHLTGNYIEHPANDDEDDYDEEYDDEYDDDDEDDDEYDLTPDEDEIIEEIEEEQAEPGKIEEIVEETKKRPASEAVDEQEEEKGGKESKKAKAAKKAKKAEKTVQFTKELEQGPSGSTFEKKKYPIKTLLGGVITEDRKQGSGPEAKSGNKVGIRYIGKLKNGKVFDKNTSGKPFSFKLGKGECIKGFDLGVAGMSVGGERRVIIPPKMGYGSQLLPGIPANSELTFDIKLVSLK